MHNGILISAQSNYMEAPDGFPFCQRFPAASCRTQVAHLTLWGVFSFAPAPKRVSIVSMLPTRQGLEPIRAQGLVFYRMHLPRFSWRFLSPVDISALLAAKSKTQGGETLRLFHFIFEKEIMEK